MRTIFCHMFKTSMLLYGFVPIQLSVNVMYSILPITRWQGLIQVWDIVVLYGKSFHYNGKFFWDRKMNQRQERISKYSNEEEQKISGVIIQVVQQPEYLSVVLGFFPTNYNKWADKEHMIINNLILVLTHTHILEYFSPEYNGNILIVWENGIWKGILLPLSVFS